MGFRKVAGSMGFRSYVRQFLGAILMLFRPSLPWGFAAGSGSILGIAACHRSSKSRSSSSRKQEEKVAKKVATIIFSIGFRRVAGAGAAAAAGGNRRKKSLKSSFSMGFRSYIRQFSGAILMLSVLHCHGDLLLGVVRFLAATGVAGAGAAAGAAAGNRRKK